MKTWQITVLLMIWAVIVVAIVYIYEPVTAANINAAANTAA